MKRIAILFAAICMVVASADQSQAQCRGGGFYGGRFHGPVYRAPVYRPSFGISYGNFRPYNNFYRPFHYGPVRPFYYGGHYRGFGYGPGFRGISVRF